jgi:hypothetical protein
MIINFLKIEKPEFRRSSILVEMEQVVVFRAIGRES